MDAHDEKSFFPCANLDHDVEKILSMVKLGGHELKVLCKHGDDFPHISRGAWTELSCGVTPHVGQVRCDGRGGVVVEHDDEGDVARWHSGRGR